MEVVSDDAVRERPVVASAFLLVSLAVAVGEAQLVRDWHAVRSAHFELVSRYDPVKTGPLLMELEWARAFFETNFGLKSALGRRVLILVPDSPFDYEQVSPSKFSAGYYLGAPWRDILVLRDLVSARRARHGVLHEYTHLVLQHQGGRWPAWFNEGTAEFYATMRPSKQGVEAGRPDPGHIAILRRGTWLPASYVISLGSASKLPSVEAGHRFYAQCWLYVHMLHLAPGYRHQFPQFGNMIQEGHSAEDALRRVYGKSLVQFDEDAREWFRRGRSEVETFKAPRQPGWDVAAKVIGEVDVEIARATVAASGPGKSQADPHYKRLSRQAGERCDLQAALGDLAFAARLFREASTHYREAVRCGVSAAELAQGLELAMSYRSDLRLEELESLVAISGSGRAHYLLGRGRFFANDYEGALREFENASGLDQPDAFRMTRLKAMSLAQLRRFAEAQTVAEKLRSLARDTEQHRSAQLTIDDIQRARQLAETPPEPPRQVRLQPPAAAPTRSKPTAAPQEPHQRALLRQLTRLDGEVIRVDCMGERARFWVRSGLETKKLIIVNPKEVVTGPDAAQLEFRCGTQRRAVIIGYEARNDPATDTVGRIRYVEFR